MQRSMGLLAVAACLVLAMGVWRTFGPDGESGRAVGEIDAEQASVQRMLERTLRESRTGDEAPATIPAPSEHALPREASPAQAEAFQPAASANALPEGYTLGTYRGAMQRAARNGIPVSARTPNPDWLGSDSTHDAILDQAIGAGRTFTFAVLRVLPGTDLQALNRSLVSLGSRIEGNTGEYVRIRVPAERDRLESIARLTGVLGMGAVLPGMKADGAFVQEAASLPASEPIPVYITLMAPDVSGEWRRPLTELGVVVGAYDRDLHSYTANMPAATLASLLSADFVRSVERIPIVIANHASAVPVMGVDGMRHYEQATARFSGLTGSGVSVGVMDTGLNASHMDIAHGRTSICGFNFVGGEDWDLWLDLHGHGTHVTGTIAGAGRTHPALAGIAPELSHLSFAKVLTHVGRGISDDIRRGMDYLSRATSCTWRGARSEAVKPLIVNMSLAAVSSTFSGRGVGARKLDSVVYEHSQLYVVAQANSRNLGFSNYGAAKNSLSVGAVRDSGILAEFSSLGPTADGRLTPSVVGTGVNLTSARGSASESGHRTLTGTNMASASVAGVAALLMEARPEFRDRAALARARLMASAIRPHAYLASRAALPVDNTDGPGAFQSRYGMGLVSARTSLFSRDDPEGWIIGSASSQPDNDSYEFIDIEVPEGAGRLDIVLAWDEQPADVLTRSVLNNLDLWADQGADCGEDACGEHSSRSEVDNIEWLLIEDPVPGTYRIKVVPVEIYGESSTAAVAWKILRGDPVPKLDVEVEDTSQSANSEYVTFDVTINASRHVASGTTLHLGCRGWCSGFLTSYLPHRTHVERQDGVTAREGLAGTSVRLLGNQHVPAIAVGEVSADQASRVQLWFRRDELGAHSEHKIGDTVAIVARSWNAEAAGTCLKFVQDGLDAHSDCGAPLNDRFSASELIEGSAGEVPADFLLASRDPGDPGVSAENRTLWYAWQAPADGLFRFRVRIADSGLPESADFTLFTGDSLAGLDMAADKHDASEFSFAAVADTEYRLRIAHDGWVIPPPLVLSWESADSRPANDDFAFAQAIDGDDGVIEATNAGATVEHGEFLGGAAASIWYRWTAPEDGLWVFQLYNVEDLFVQVFEGARIDALRLLSKPEQDTRAYLLARAGGTYHVLVGSLTADASAQHFRLRWRSRPHTSLGNSRFEGAIELGGRVGREPVSEGELVEPGEPEATGVGTRWWQWTAPADGRFTWRMDQSVHSSDRTSTLFQLTLFTGETLQQLEFVGSLTSGGDALVLDATEGVRYWIAFGRNPEFPGDLMRSVHVDPPVEFNWGPTPENDDRVAAGPVVGVAGSAHATLGYATRATNEPFDTVGADSVWWRWRAPRSGWQRFWVDGHPLSTVLAVYPGSVALRAIADSDRTILANGRVELHLLAEAGQVYDIRLATRPGLEIVHTGPREERTATLRWEEAATPAYLAYKGAVTHDSLAYDPVWEGYRWPSGLAVRDDGEYLYSSSEIGILGFLRDPKSGELALAHAPPQTMVEAPLRTVALWWNTRHDRLFGMSPSEKRIFSFEWSENGAPVSPGMITLSGGSERLSDKGLLSPDGRHFYVQDPDRQTIDLQVYSVDTPKLWTRVQTVKSQGAPGDDALIVPGMDAAVDMTFSSEGRYLYVGTNGALVVFARDATTGRLLAGKEIQRDIAHGSPFALLQDIQYVTLGGDGATLFVAGKTASLEGYRRFSEELAIAAFDISADPSNPMYLDSLSRLAWQTDRDIFGYMRSHVSRPEPFDSCVRPVPHADHAAVDFICLQGYFVVEWNSGTGALEVTDWAATGATDRFGNTLPYNYGVRAGVDRYTLTRSPDGAHAYLAVNARASYWGHSEAIHIFERASAMTPMERVDPPEPMEPANPDNPTGVDDMTTPEPDTVRDCYVGLLVGIGESCRYPATTDEFRVNVRGRASFLGRLAGIVIRFDNETINGRVYNFEARHQGEGVWRINRVGDST